MLTLEEGETGGSSRAGLEELDDGCYIIKKIGVSKFYSQKNRKIIKPKSKIQTAKPRQTNEVHCNKSLVHA